MPAAPTKARRRVVDDEEEDFDDGSEEEAAAATAEAAKNKEAPVPVPEKKKSVYGDGDEFYSVGAYGKKTAKLAELASLACSNSDLVGRKIEEYA